MEFCEGRVFGHPEYFSSFSSFFICYFGLVGLYRCPSQNLFGQLVYALMFINGVGSFGYHWTGNDMWRYLDGNPMILASAIGALFTLDEVIRVHYLRKNSKNKHITVRLVSSINAIFWAGFAIVSLWMDTQPQFQFFSQASFQIPVAITVFAVMLARFFTHKTMLADDWKIIDYAKIGLGAMLLSATIWIVTEKNCDQHPWLAFFYGHVIWHIGMSWGLFLTLQFVIWFTAHRYNCRPYLDERPWYMFFGPIVKYDIVPVLVPLLESDKFFHEDARQLFATVPSFSSVKPAELDIFAQSAQRHLFPASEVILKEGDSGNSMFVVAAGQIEVLHAHDQAGSLTLSRGALIGEMSLLTGRVRSATVKTLSMAVLYEMRKKDFVAVLKKRPSLIDEMAGLLSHRTKHSRARFNHFKRVIEKNCLTD